MSRLRVTTGDSLPLPSPFRGLKYFADETRSDPVGAESLMVGGREVGKPSIPTQVKSFIPAPPSLPGLGEQGPGTCHLHLLRVGLELGRYE